MSKQIVFVPVSDLRKYFGPGKCRGDVARPYQLSRLSMKQVGDVIEKQVREGQGRDIFRHTALGQMSQYLKRVWGCPTSIPSLTLFTINFHFLQMSYQLSRLSMSQYLWHPF